MSLKDGMAYRERHGKGTLIPCFLIIIMLSLATVYIINYGMSNGENNNENPTSYQIQYVLYSEDYNVTGKLTVYDVNESIFEVIDVKSDGAPVSVRHYSIGDYKVYYEGTDNGVVFGPIEFTIPGPDSLFQPPDLILISREYAGVMFTVRIP